MEKHIEEPTKDTKVNNYFYLLGALFGGLTGGFIQESVLAALIGAVIGLAFAGFFVGNLLKGREHDR
ncbi:hypothetical protein SAMN05660226_02816 [Parapedobacter luteus]|uniref:Uncharacterized protein n=1 Tax=Parapedobacter luteus TaxID=623280 RepID=A0A1T5DHE2_9SPHI|nr:hypothetical protein [Parapedobacter luteus]SKB70991.1 hypothetical protein SAMN05660226_02816 [Parapedobacter luteus]